MLTMLAAVAEFERNLMRERQVEGIAKAKAAGKYRGREPKHDHDEVRALAVQIGAEAAAVQLGLHRGTVYRIIGEAREAA